MTIPEDTVPASSEQGREHIIEVKIEGIEQLFNSIDPSPFHEKDLDHDLEEFIISWATEYPLHAAIRLVVYLHERPPDPNAAAVIERAVHNYFAYKAGLNQRELRQLFREGRLSLVIGLSFLAVCLLLAEMSTALPMPGAKIAEASLTIAGWVAMWHPMDTFLYGWWPLRRAGKVLRKLSTMPVEVRQPEPPKSAENQAVSR